MSAGGPSLSDLAAEARDEGRWHDAAMLYGRLAKEAPADPDLACWHGFSLWNAGDLEGAIGEYARAEKLAPDWSGVNNCMGTINRELGNIDEALAQYGIAVRKEPHYAEAHANLAETFWRMGRLADAAVHFRRAIETKPDWAEMYDDLALVLVDQGHLAEANMAIREGIRICPERTASKVTLATVLSHQDKHDEAEATLQEVLKIAPDDGELWSRLSWLRRRAKKYPEAALAAQEAIWRDSQIPYPHFLLGWIAAKNGEREAAISHYKRYLELDPDDTEGAALGLSHLGAAPPPQRASESYMKQIYATRSAFWDENIGGETQYAAPKQIADALERFMGPRRNLDIMDVGCGTGLGGPLLRERAKVLDGLDLSAHMLEKAREKDIYDDLIEGDLEQVLYQRPEEYDVITCAATLIHFGDLLPPLKACAAALRPAGWMAFTVFPNKDGVGMMPFFCHSHSPEHVRDRANAAGFDVISMEEHIHEHQYGEAVPGLVVVLRKRGGAPA